MDFILGCLTTAIFFIVFAKIQENEENKTNIGKARNEMYVYESTKNVKHLIEARKHLEREIFKISKEN